MSTTKETTTPVKCPKCGHLLGRPPAWLRMLEAMSPGVGNVVVGYTPGRIAELSGMSRQHVNQAIPVAAAQGLIEKVPGVEGKTVWRKTHYGTVTLSKWKAAGWSAGRPKR